MRSVQVIKVGGAQIESSEGLAALSEYVEDRGLPEGEFVLVHGGGRELSALQESLGIEVRKVLGLRVTTARAMDTTAMVLCGLVNKRLVGHLVAAGHKTVGLCGADFGFMRSSLLNPERLGRVGGPPRIDPEPIRCLLEAGCLVVVASVCLGKDGGLVNVNADAVAQSLAVALGATTLEFVSDVDALHGDDGPLERVSAREVDRLVTGPAVHGGMVPKLQATLAALEGGVDEVRIGSFASLARGEGTVVHA